jgi:DNA-directed RNA polymerase specialized sigma24 family protein
MDHDTDIGGPHHRFPVTNQSAILAVSSEDHEVRQRAFETILASYWKPAYKYIRIKWQATNEDAKDLTQGFFASAIEKNYFAGYDARKASFQTFLRTCLDGFVANQKKADSRLKRGGGMSQFSFDFVSAEDEFMLQPLVSNATPEEYFHREWVRSLFVLAVETLRRRCDQSQRTVHFKLFEIYDLDDDEVETKTSYATLAQQFGLNTTTVNNYLAAMRREFRKILLEKLREITATEEEFLREAHALLGVKTI